MKFETLVLGQLQTNCYLVWDEETKEAIVIDPADEADYIIRKILDLDLNLRLILATHGHFDHVLGLLELKLAFNVPFLMNTKDNFLLKRSSQTAKHFTKVSTDPTPDPDQNLDAGLAIKFGKQILQVIETPGHTPGSVCFYSQGILFSGDTIFENGFGRTDLSYSSKSQMQTSINKLEKLPEKTLVYPGHGQPTTIKRILSMLK